MHQIRYDITSMAGLNQVSIVYCRTCTMKCIPYYKPHALNEGGAYGRAPYTCAKKHFHSDPLLYLMQSWLTPPLQFCILNTAKEGSKLHTYSTGQD